jgi:hypothetical protein
MQVVQGHIINHLYYVFAGQVDHLQTLMCVVWACSRRVSGTPFQAVRCLRPTPASRNGLCVRAEAARAQAGDFVAVDYTGTLDDGSVFDTSRKEGRTPLEFQIGGGMVRHHYRSCV